MMDQINAVSRPAVQTTPLMHQLIQRKLRLGGVHMPRGPHSEMKAKTPDISFGPKMPSGVPSI